jgi:hypothetical protein
MSGTLGKRPAAIDVPVHEWLVRHCAVTSALKQRHGPPIRGTMLRAVLNQSFVIESSYVGYTVSSDPPFTP